MSTALARLAALVGVALLVLAAPAAARPLVHVAPAFPVTDGRAVAAWVDTAGRLQVAYDDGVRRAFAGPGRTCALGGVNRTEAGFLCLADTDSPHTMALVDLATGQIHPPATEALVESSTPQTAGFASYDLEGLGDHVAHIGYGDFHTEGELWLSLDAGGGALDLHAPPIGSVVDLDAPSGLTPVCAPAPTRRMTVLYRAPWILTQHGARLQLRRCGSRTTRLIGRVRGPGPVLTGRFAAWVSDPAHVTIRMLASGRTYRVRAAHLRAIAATDHRLWTDPYPGTPRAIAVR